MSAVSPEREILTREQAAEFLNMGVRTIDDLVRKGLIPSHKRVGRRLFLRSELVEWVKQAEAA